MSRCCAASGWFPVKDVPGHDEDRQPVAEPVERDHSPIR